MRAWQYASTKGGLEKNLKLNPSAPLPTVKPNQNLIQIIAVALNPVDFKPAEIPFAGRFLVPKLATPGIDIAGCIVTPAQGSAFKRGQLVFGGVGTTPCAGGGLAEFGVAQDATLAAIPDGVDLTDAACVCIAGLTAYETIVPRVKKGDRIFINGGSGGTGIFGIQIAKIVGCHVTTTCSTTNVELCKSLGADEVVDYTKGSVVEALKASGGLFDHVVDNVGSDLSLYWRCHEYTKPGAVFLMIAGNLNLDFMMGTTKAKLLPSALGGGRRKMETFFLKPSSKGLEQTGRWMKEGKVRAVFDSKYAFEQAPEAFERLKTGRAKGKIVLDVASKTYRKTWEQ